MANLNVLQGPVCDSSVLFRVNPNGKIRSVSGSCEKILSYTQKELVGQNLIATIHPNDQQKVLNQLARLTSQPEMSLTYRRITKNSYVITVAVTITAIRYDESAPLAVINEIIVLEDLEDSVELRHNTVQQLASDVSMLESLISTNSRDVICQLSLNHTFTYVSPSCAHRWKQPPSDFVGKSIWPMVHIEDIPSLEKSFIDLVYGKETAVCRLYRRRIGIDSYEWEEVVITAYLESPRVGHFNMLSRVVDIPVMGNASTLPTVDQFPTHSTHQTSLSNCSIDSGYGSEY